MNFDAEQHARIVINSIRASKKSLPFPLLFSLLCPVISIFSLLILIALAIVANAIQVLFLPVNFLYPRFYYELNGFLAGSLWRFCHCFFCYYSGAHITVTSMGNICLGENAIIVSSHRFFGDYLLLNELALQQRMINYCTYFVKDSGEYIAFIGWGMYMMDCILVKRNWAKDEKRIKGTFSKYLK